jgi:acetyl esterase
VDISRLHPQARAALGVQQRVPLTLDDVDAVRRSMRDATADEVGAGPRLWQVRDVDAGGVPARFYRDGADRPVLLFAHGGGWVLGDLDTHDGLCRHLAAATGWSVLAVDYRRPPEHPYPAALDDAERALGWLRATGVQRIAVAGDSAGGHIAAVVARRARDAGRPVAAQVLICPVIDPGMDYPPLDEAGLDRGEMRFFWDAVAPAGVDRTHVDVDLMAADPAGLPPTVIVSAELDVLCTEAERYAIRLQNAGVPVISTRFQGMNHNFVRKLALFDAAHVALAQISAALQRWS